MREILFRGKCSVEAWMIADVGDWVYGGYIPPANKYFKKHLIGNMADCVEVDLETVGQFTGLTDKNGTKIFEGDIVSFADCWDTQHKGVVCWHSGSYDVDCSKSDEDKDIFRLFTAYACGAEIIGNIHDNPELLGGE